MITTEAWVLARGSPDEPVRPGVLVNEPFSFSDPAPEEVLVEPLYGCWEANMAHALLRNPIDICRERDEAKVVLGNAGVVRVLRPGSAVTTLRAGDLCLVFCNGATDRHGYPVKIYAYDAPGSIGVLARQTKLHANQLLKVPKGSRFSLPQWAAFSLRYVTAWANWKVAYGCWRVLTAGLSVPPPFVWGWGGGVAYAELTLARQLGCPAAMIASSDARCEQLRQGGLVPVDRRAFAGLAFDEARYRAEPPYRKTYLEAEERFLRLVQEHTQGHGVSIFIDLIGLPVFRATLKALARPGVVTTAGWKKGMTLSVVRALECIQQHVHVFTHYARHAEAVEAVNYAEETGWLPAADSRVYTWDEIPALAQDYGAGTVESYFPLFQVNAE